MAHISIRGLVKKYGRDRAVADVSLEIANGEFLVLLGPSGCGKTSILRCIAGLENVTCGEISINDKVVSSSQFSLPPEKRSIGMVFQSYALWPHKTVEENVSFGLELQGIETSQIKQKVERVLSLVGLTEYATRAISQLSGGQQQRVALARAVVLEPRVLLFDEPLSNLDAKLREHMRFELRQLQKLLGITTVYVTHDQQEAMVVADRIVLLREGLIDQISTPVDIYENPASVFGADFIGLANIHTGQVIQSGETTRVQLSEHMQIDCIHGQFATGQSVDVMSRPEQVIVSTSPLQGANVWQGQVSHTFFLGNVADVYVNIGGLQVRSQLSPPQHLDNGQTVWIHIPPQALRLYGHQSKT
ncbi:MAG: ABC transporter ATP-binding protein [Limnohabitans sp.]|nr:ABC transporter ATP-binding protein [Limnohabitans sp.]